MGLPPVVSTLRPENFMVLLGPLTLLFHTLVLEVHLSWFPELLYLLKRESFRVGENRRCCGPGQQAPPEEKLTEITSRGTVSREWPPDFCGCYQSLLTEGQA